MWYNKVTFERQSNPPYNEWLHPDIVNEIYADWGQVPDDFVLPPKPKDKQTQLKELDNKYSSQFDKFKLSYIAIDITEKDATKKQTKKTNIETQYSQLKASYDAERDAILNG
jgi:hypothetical protein